MFNSQMPDISELPTSRQLVRSTLIALVGAGALLVTVVLPSEYGIDPTGAGRILGLTEMGEIKMQLAEEAAADMASEPQFDDLPSAEAAANPSMTVANRSDRKEITLAPGEGAEIKLSARQGVSITYSWSVSGGAVNYDAHGDPSVKRLGFYHGYGKGKASVGQKGAIVTAFDGTHGWFWRNRSERSVIITLQTSGAYTDIRRVV
jgi:hypothetical protein